MLNQEMQNHTLIPFRYVELYPEYRPHYRPFGFGYEIYVRVSILYTQNGKRNVSQNITPIGAHMAGHG